MPEPSAAGPDPEALLAAHAAATPEAPFLFSRAPGGHFEWWSWRRAAEELATGRSEDVRGRFLRDLTAQAASSRTMSVALVVAAAALPDGRPIWMTRGELSGQGSGLNATVGLAALAGGWAVVVEPGERLHPETFLWARPSVVAEPGARLVELIEGITALAPRWRREPWLRRRLARLTLIVTSEPEAQSEVGELWRRSGSSARVLCIPPDGW